MRFRYVTIFIMISTIMTLLTSYSTAAVIASPGSNWLQFGFTPQHSGVNTTETAITPANVSGLKLLFQVKLPAIADGAPVYLSSVRTPQGTRDLLFLTTQNGYILAVDAHTGSTIWRHQLGPGTCKINNSGGSCYTTSSPVIDPGLNYVYSYGLDGFVHKFQVGDGKEITDAHWPEVASLKPWNEKGSSALSFATASNGTTYLYMASAGYPGDQGDYQGHLTVIDLSTGLQQVFNANCSNQAVHFKQQPQTPDCSQVQTAIWARPSAVYDPDTNRVYFATGNGLYDPSSYAWGDSVLAINPNGQGAGGSPLDSYTPTNQQTLYQTDADLGSTALAILPVPANSKYRHIAVQGGKDQQLRLINLDNMSGQGGPGHMGGEIGPVIPVPQGGMVFATPAVWVNPANNETWVFVTTGSGISGLKLSIDANGTPSLQPVWQKPQGGTSPVLANNILFYANSGTIRALNPLNGSLLWNSTQIAGIHWESPIVINGIVYITDNNSQLSAFNLVNSANLTNHLYLPSVLR